jgi:hypothetical protein
MQPNFEFDVGEFDQPKTEDKLEHQMLHLVQGVGSIKSVNGIDVYVKADHCEESIKELIKLLKFDDSL